MVRRDIALRATLRALAASRSCELQRGRRFGFGSALIAILAVVAVEVVEVAGGGVGGHDAGAAVTSAGSRDEAAVDLVSCDKSVHRHMEVDKDERGASAGVAETEFIFAVQAAGVTCGRGACHGSGNTVEEIISRFAHHEGLGARAEVGNRPQRVISCNMIVVTVSKIGIGSCHIWEVTAALGTAGDFKGVVLFKPLGIDVGGNTAVTLSSPGTVDVIPVEVVVGKV